jgi:hypothetical protein
VTAALIADVEDMTALLAECKSSTTKRVVASALDLAKSKLAAALTEEGSA